MPEKSSLSKNIKISLLKKTLITKYNFKFRGKKGDYLVGHLFSLLEDRKDVVSLDGLIYLFGRQYLDNPKIIHDGTKFYYWVKDSNITDFMIDSYRFFLYLVKDFGVDWVDPRPFISTFQNLIDRLTAWAGDTSTTVDELVEEYLTGVVVWISSSFPSRYHSHLSYPTSLFGNYGWGGFLSYLHEKYGSPRVFLKESKDILKKEKKQRKMLDFIAYKKQGYLSNNEVHKADRIEQLLDKRGVSHTYEVLKNNGSKTSKN